MGHGIRSLILVLAMSVGLPSPAMATEVRVATWNVFDLPEQIFPVASATRMKHLAASLDEVFAPIASLDAVVFTELYVEADRQRLIEALALLGLTHHVTFTSRDPRDLVSMNGLLIVSRWPIAHHASHIFRHACHGFDCFTLKGALYAELRKETDHGVLPIQLFGAHFYVGRTGHHLQARQRQAAALKAFVHAQQPRQDAAVIVAGNLNAAWDKDGPDLLTSLNNYAIEPSGPRDYTFATYGQFWSGSARQSVAQRCHQATRDAPPAAQQERKWVDYVVALAPGLEPSRSTVTSIVPTVAPYIVGSLAKAHCHSDALSDHDPVLGVFEFP